MEGATTLLSSSTHTHFPIVSKDFSLASKNVFPTSKDLYHMPPPRKRKPIFTYQSPSSGSVDVDLLIRNTTLEFEAAAVAAASRAVPPSPTLTPVPVAPSSPPSAAAIDAHARDASVASMSVESTFRITAVHRLVTVPRPPRPLYHPLSRPNSSRPSVKNDTSTSSSTTSQLAPPAAETGRRSSSRTRRPAPKIRDTEVLGSKMVQDKISPLKRRRAGGAKRKRAGAQLDVDGDGSYPSVKRTRKPREKMEMEVDSETMPPPALLDSPSGYSTRAKRPRKTGSGHVRAESSTSDGTGSVTRTTPFNGHVEEFLVPTKMA